MGEAYDKLVEMGFTGTYCEFEDILLENKEDIIDALQVGGRDDERAKRKC